MKLEVELKGQLKDSRIKRAGNFSKAGAVYVDVIGDREVCVVEEI